MKITFIFCLLIVANSAFAMPQDSIGVKIVDGKRYIMHKVTKGEGVYGISRKYGVTSAEVFAANEGSDKSLQIGQVLLIPKAGSATASSGSGSGNGSGTGSGSGNSAGKTEKVYHTVATGQTLSSIAKMHKTTVARIKELNHLKSDNITLGQKLVVGEKQSSVATTNTTKPKEKEEPNVVQAEEKKSKTEEEEEAPKNVVVKTAINDKPMADKPGTVNTYSTDDGDEVTENGIAVISSEGDLSQERSFILHPTAKIGTIVMITNTANNNAVFARVIGNCKVESGCVLKMSKTVALKLGVTEPTTVKVSYAK